MKDLFKRYLIYFFMYSLIGWFYEVFLEVVVYRWGFTNRGVLFGPYCPIYGFGALIFIIMLYKFKNNQNINLILRLFITFIGCMLIATFIELIASYILEYFTGHWLWETYKNYKYNFQGRIALSTSIRFGLGGVLFLFVLQPLFEKLTNKFNSKTITIISSVILFIFTIDCIYTFLF